MATSTGHQKIITMSAITELKARADKAWEADDGQSSVEDMARELARRAAVDGLISPVSVAAASAMLEVYLRESTAHRRTPEQEAAQAAVSARYAAVDAARRRSDSERATWLCAVEASRREVQHELRSYGTVDSWVPVMERAYAPDGSVIATRMHHEQDGWLEWEAPVARRPVEPIHATTQPAVADDSAALAFVAAIPSMTVAQSKAAYWALPSAVRNSPAIRALPKSVRRML